MLKKHELHDRTVKPVSVSEGDRAARAGCPRSSVEVGQKCVYSKGARKSNILIGTRIRCRLRNVAEMDTLTKSCSPTIVVIANGEVQTHEEAIVHVKELVYS